MACIILVTKNEWPTLRSWILHHGDLVGFKNIHVLDNSDETASVAYLQQAARDYGVRVTRSKNDMSHKGREVTSTAVAMRSDCDFIFKLDTDEFLAVYRKADNAVLVDQGSFWDEVRGLPLDGRKFSIPYRRDLQKQVVCGDTALATNYDPVMEVPPELESPKLFYPARTVVLIDAGTHFGQTTVPGTIRTNLTILHLHNKCYEVYMKHMKAVLASRGEISESQTRQQQFEALDRKKDLFLHRCGMKSCHKAREYHAFLRDPVKHRQEYLDSAAGGGNASDAVFAGLRDRVMSLKQQYGDV